MDLSGFAAAAAATSSPGMAAEREQSRKEQYKAALNPEAGRRKREEVAVKLRKQKRQERLRKRRQTSNATGRGMVAPDDDDSEPAARPAPDAAVLARIPELVRGINSPDTKVQREYTARFRKILSIERRPPIKEVIEAGVVPRLVSFLRVDSEPQLQFEAAWALTNIASGTAQDTHFVVNNNAVPHFVYLLSSPSADVREQAVWALGNIAGDSPQLRDLVLKSNALPPLLHQLQQTQAKKCLLRNATWTLSNLCRGKPQPAFELVAPALDTLAILIFREDEDILTDACWALSYLSDGPNQKIQAVIQAGVCKRLIELLLHRSCGVQTPALRTVGNIVTGDDMQTQVIIANGALQCLAKLLENHRKGIRKEACWTISNITAGSPDQIQSVLDANVIPALVKVLRHDSWDIRKESAWAISNATSGGTSIQVAYLVSQGVIPALCALLGAKDVRVTFVALEALENILRMGEDDKVTYQRDFNQYCNVVEAAEGLEALEALWNHESPQIYYKTSQILRDFWDPRDGEDSDGENATGDVAAFGVGGSVSIGGAVPVPAAPPMPPSYG